LVAVPWSPRIETPKDFERGGIALFSVSSKARVADLPAGRVLHQAFSPDARQLAVITPKEIVLWDLISRKAVRRFSNQLDGWVGGSCTIAFTPDGRRMITAKDDWTALIWDLTGTGRAPGAVAPPLSADALAKHWEALAADDAANAYAAGWELADRGGHSVALLRERLKPVKAAEKADVERLVAQLDSERYADREAATKSLREMGDSAVPALKALRKAGLSAEADSRVGKLLSAAAAPVPASGREMQQVRAVAIVERIGSDEARKLLRELAGGLAEARLTQEAIQAFKNVQAIAVKSK
jgi:hypothetical protein